jgi:hypothetical protein
MPVARPEIHPLRNPHNRRALQDTAGGVLSLRGTTASGSSGLPLKPFRLGRPRDQGSHCSLCIKASPHYLSFRCFGDSSVISWMVRH